MIIVERIEGEKAVLECDGENVTVDTNQLPEGAREGDLLIKTDGVYAIDVAATSIRRQKMLNLKRKIERKHLREM